MSIDSVFAISPAQYAEYSVQLAMGGLPPSTSLVLTLTENSRITSVVTDLVTVGTVKSLILRGEKSLSQYAHNACVMYSCGEYTLPNLETSLLDETSVNPHFYSIFWMERIKQHFQHRDDQSSRVDRSSHHIAINQNFAIKNSIKGSSSKNRLSCVSKKQTSECILDACPLVSFNTTIVKCQI